MKAIRLSHLLAVCLFLLPTGLFSYSFRVNKQLYPTGQAQKANEESVENILLGDGGLLQIKNSSLAEIGERLA